MPKPHFGKQIQERGQQLGEHAQQKVAIAQRRWYELGRIGSLLLVVYVLMSLAFGMLAYWVHVHPLLPIDVTITHDLQTNLWPWLEVLMIVISYPGSSLVLSVLIVVTVIAFWIFGLRLEAIVMAVLCAFSEALNVLLKFLVARPRPTAHLVDVIEAARGSSFPSEHVMLYLAYWGLLFCFAILLFRGWRWWRLLLLGISTLFIVLVGPSRVYLGDHWASDVLGSYLLEGVLLGITLWVYLLLRRRGILETKKAVKIGEKNLL